ncbi:hypothetical protein Pint_35799 [Pistacia integerrima]|uniref:Uncharacterized protein n=1 Tax=Pistacia integerrima TaxID=434235 RepID=A0ACC0Y0F4_9ROSI|nr:hypothetical protein Pint_35799 [Pistacia integerrima]
MEIQVFKEFSEMLSGNCDKACYGPKNVDVVHEFKVIKMLLISEDLVKSAEIERRWKYVELVKSVKSVRGKALMYLSKHVFGEQSTTLTGIATRPSNIRPVPMGKRVPVPNGQVRVSFQKTRFIQSDPYLARP